MAGLVFAPPARHILCVPRSEIKLTTRLPQRTRVFLQKGSRAAYFATTNHRRDGFDSKLNANNVSPYSIRGRAAFSTSSAWRAEQASSQKQQLEKPIHKVEVDPTLSTTNPTLRETLKTKLAPLRHENIYNIPNILTFSRLIATPVIGYLIINDHPLYAFSLFAYAGFSDLLDGWIARKWNLQTVVGSVVDPMADKALMTTVVVCLAVNGSLALPLATLILGRDVSLATAAIYYRYASLPAPKTFARYWDFSLPSAEVHPTTVSKLNTFLQLGLIGTTMCVGLLHDPSATSSAAGSYLLAIQDSLGGPEGVQTLVRSISGVVAATTIWSGMSYAFLKDAVTILGTDEALKKKQGFRGRMIIGVGFGSVVLVSGWLVLLEWIRYEEEEAGHHD